ncbi:MAG: hypothetical protein IJ662_09025 [Clostridia bacterium]|nr:hypothetical protein [Clostridia bacterium]
MALQTISISDLMPKIVTYGRTVMDEENGYLRCDWTASGIELDFEGDYLSAILAAEPGEEIEGLPTDPNAPRRATWPWVGVFLDDMDQPIRRFPVCGKMETWLLIRSDAAQRHHFRIMKLTENVKTFFSIRAMHYSGEFHPCARRPRRRIEFVGDSITCGYGNLCPDRDRGFWSDEEDGWNAHGPIAARLLGMEASCVSVSGITVAPHAHFPQPYAMNQLYAYADRPGRDRHGKAPEQWDFAALPNDYVVVNLGTNDACAASFAPDFEAERERFCRDYTAFLGEIRRLNGPATRIICALGSMQYYLYPEIAQAVEEHKRLTGDQLVHLFRYHPMAPLDGFGAAGHPSLTTQKKMAEELAAFIAALA